MESKYIVGQRVRATRTNDVFDLEKGDTGTVDRIDSDGDAWVKWDGERSTI